LPPIQAGWQGSFEVRQIEVDADRRARGVGHLIDDRDDRIVFAADRLFRLNLSRHADVLSLFPLFRAENLAQAGGGRARPGFLCAAIWRRSRGSRATRRGGRARNQPAAGDYTFETGLYQLQMRTCWRTQR
jgi:hypothetical protein